MKFNGIKLVRKLLMIPGYICMRISKIYQTSQEKTVDKWFRDQGDRSHRLNYDLNDKSIVLDLGGFEGQWASDIYSMYGCNIYIFEIVESFSQRICIRFKRNDKIKVFNFGLSNETRKITTSVDGDKSSVIKTRRRLNQTKSEANFIKASDYFMQNNINKVDLMKINIEGGEYDLIEHLIDSGWIQRIDNIQVQFHDFVPHGQVRMKSIQENLQRTHFITYQYHFVWENWKRK